jgi:hypothetical protein
MSKKQLIWYKFDDEYRLVRVGTDPDKCYFDDGTSITWKSFNIVIKKRLLNGTAKMKGKE